MATSAIPNNQQSSLVASFASGTEDRPGSRDPSPEPNWQPNEKATNCKRCSASFTHTFRRHHCRHCGVVVCDGCSTHRIRLPHNPTWGKVRVCDACVKSIGENHASGFEEDLQVNSEIINSLRIALSQSYAECEEFKHVLLKLDSDATGDSSALEEYATDPESDAHSFNVLKDRIVSRWEGLKASLEEQNQTAVELHERHGRAVENRDEAVDHERALKIRRADLDAELAEMARIEGQRDELVREETELQRSVVAARRRVRELELERKEQQERQSQARHPRLPGPSPGQSGGNTSPSRFTITNGRDEPLIGTRPSSRLEGCTRQSCAVM